MNETILNFILSLIGGALSAIIVSLLSKEKTKAEINNLNASTNKLALDIKNIQKEPNEEIIDNISEKMATALGRMAALSTGFRIEADLNHMSPDQISEYLKNSPFSKFEKDNLLDSTDKNNYYRQLREYHEHFEAKRAIDDFHNYIVLKRIRINYDLMKYLTELDELLYRVINAQELSMTKIAPQSYAAIFSEFHQKIEPLNAQIEEQMKKVINQ